MSKTVIKKSISIIVAATLMLLLTACSTPPEASGKLSVVTVIFPQYDFARAVSGDTADVHMLMKPGAEIHSFEPSVSDIKTIANADVFIYGGGESDTWIEEILEAIDTSDIKIVQLMDFVPLLEEVNPTGTNEHTHHHTHDDECDEHDHGEYDEHIWTSPQNAKLMVNAICSAMCGADEENSLAYKANAENYIKKIDSADDALKNATGNAKTDFIAVGDRFPFLYMTEEYHLRYAAVFAGCSTENDANPSVMVNMIKTMQKENTPVVFYTEMSDMKMADTISEETGAVSLMLHSCQSISKEDFDSGKTYVDIMKENASALKEALN